MSSRLLKYTVWYQCVTRWIYLYTHYLRTRCEQQIADVPSGTDGVASDDADAALC